ncbi:MAG: tRNA uridine-5-carboxymethylaminomethyl(34) synthesis GTPase MnmE, partial [Gammaproteobacteria bacterium]|nr:tRNA uridine-5-carboxymethylaminomethyl(34) synthesis GTPase MnmE [Gammaproteobacteria bacterium]
MNSSTDTIAAIATPPGRGGVGIIRLSGPGVKGIAEQTLGHVPAPRQAEYLAFKDEQGVTLDEGIALYFVAPHSFTGEDVLELQAHGGPVVLDMLLQAVVRMGARIARPGEFSERAFLNDKLDLAQAEAIADLIDASSEQAARSALRSLQGDFSNRVHALVEQLIHLRMYVEAAIDFPEEEVDFLADEKIKLDLQSINTDLVVIMQQAQQGSLMREGMRVVIVGRPNAGKSSLLNALAGRESAIVTDIPGTTRDVLREQIIIDGMPLHIIDTAGLRDSDDVVEQIGIQRAMEEVQQADRILLMVDDQQGLGAEEQKLLDGLPASAGVTMIHNKIDLSGRAAGEQQLDA